MRAYNALTAAAIIFGCAMLLFTAPAVAYVTCNMRGDCWKTDGKVKWSGVSLMYHDDSWWDEHQNDSRYRMHPADDQHDWRRGYWDDHKWYRG